MLAVYIGVPVFILMVILAFWFLNCITMIGPTEIGLVQKRIGRKLPEDNPIALHGEAGFQIGLLMPGLRFVLWPIFSVKKFPWIQIPAGEIGVVIAQAGAPLPIGAKSATYKTEFGNFTDAKAFLEHGGIKGVQRPVLPPGTLVPMHPIVFLVITKAQVYGNPVSPELTSTGDKTITSASFGLNPKRLELVRIEPSSQGMADQIGIVTTFEGDPLPSGLIAGRLGGFDDIRAMEQAGAGDADIVENLLAAKNTLHNNYQDFQAFLNNGGRIGLQHDPLLYGAYALNPFLIDVQMMDMLIIRQGEVGVMKAYVGLATEDTSGADFKYGSLVRPGHRGIWREPLRTGKYAINPRCYQAEIVPTAILTLNWAEAVSQAHNLDKHLSQIAAKSKEGFIFKIDLQVQIHVPDSKAPRVISMVGTMVNLVNEVLQPAVGNHFRDRLQSMEAIRFIEQRQSVQIDAQEHVARQLAMYEVETKGVYIQDVIFPEQLVLVLTDREIANQQVETYGKQQEAQARRVALEQSKGTADMQAELARAQVGVDIKTNNADARKKEGEGEAAYISQTGTAQGAQIEAVGLARAKAYREQVQALGQQATALVNAIAALSEGKNRFVPEVLVTSGGGALEGLGATLIEQLRSGKLMGKSTESLEG